jgi:hypothetical protein
MEISAIAPKAVSLARMAPVALVAAACAGFIAMPLEAAASARYGASALRRRWRADRLREEQARAQQRFLGLEDVAAIDEANPDQILAGRCIMLVADRLAELLRMRVLAELAGHTPKVQADFGFCVHSVGDHAKSRGPIRAATSLTWWDHAVRSTIQHGAR